MENRIVSQELRTAPCNPFPKKRRGSCLALIFGPAILSTNCKMCTIMSVIQRNKKKKNGKEKKENYEHQGEEEDQSYKRKEKEGKSCWRCHKLTPSIPCLHAIIITIIIFYVFLTTFLFLSSVWLAYVDGQKKPYSYLSSHCCISLSQFAYGCRLVKFSLLESLLCC